MPIRATMLLADSAQAVEGKLYILGGGWNITGPDPTPSAIAVYIEVSWDLSNMRHPWSLELVDSDGQPVLNQATAFRWQHVAHLVVSRVRSDASTLRGCALCKTIPSQ